MSTRPALVAGVDIGNTTTEIVLAEVSGRAATSAAPGAGRAPPVGTAGGGAPQAALVTHAGTAPVTHAGTVATPVAHGSVLTAGRKGSPASVQAAWRLLDRLERSAGRRCERIAIADAIPVQTGIRSFVRAAPRFTRLVPLDAGTGDTRSGAGVAVGRPVLLADLQLSPRPEMGGSGGEPAAGRARDEVVVLVPAGIDFARAAESINAAIGEGFRVRGVLVGGDEAVLIGNRLRTPLPVIDEADVSRAACAERVLLEVAPDGEAIRVLADPLALSAALGLPADALAEAEQVARDYADARSGAVAYAPGERQPPSDPGQPRPGKTSSAWIEFIDADGARERLPIVGNYRELARRIAPGSVRALCLPRRRRSAGRAAAIDDQVRDFFAPDLPAILAQPLVRRGEVVLQEVPAALLKGDGCREEARALLEELSERPVVVAAAEPRAARLGALTTPAAPPSAAVCDVGGGTIDLVDGENAVTAAGAGELLTLAVALAAGIPRGTAERVKRHRSYRVESPSLIHDEDGRRRFAEPAVHGRYVGRLCVDTGRAVLPFADRLSPEEWRALRLTLKVETLGVNIERALGGLPGVLAGAPRRAPRQLVLCGGCALDDELVRAVADGLRRERVLVGRANVAGTLGPRYAVALGLVLCCVE